VVERLLAPAQQHLELQIEVLVVAEPVQILPVLAVQVS
jgi:hypothetical protein